MAQVQKTEKIEDEAQREAPLIKPKAVQSNYDGFAWREFFVRLPSGIVAQDLGDSPQIWKLVQAEHGKAMRRGDRVTAFSHDESWAIKDALVVEANMTKVVLAIDKIIRLPTREEEFFSADGQYHIRWGGPGYTTYRVRDGAQVTPGFHQTIEPAKNEMFKSLYPKRVS